jgi:hypothetical protein
VVHFRDCLDLRFFVNRLNMLNNSYWFFVYCVMYRFSFNFFVLNSRDFLPHFHLGVCLNNLFVSGHFLLNGVVKHLLLGIIISDTLLVLKMNVVVLIVIVRVLAFFYDGDRRGRGFDCLRNLGFHGVFEGRLFLLLRLDNLLVFLAVLILVFLFEVDSDLVVDEGDDHAVVELDQVGGLVLGHLAVRLHEHEGPVAAQLVLPLLGDRPSLASVIVHTAVVSRYRLQLDHYLTLHRAPDAEEVLRVRLKQDFLLDGVLGLVGADPGGSCAEGGGLLGILIFDVVGLVLEEYLEGGRGLHGGRLFVGDLVEMVVNDLAQVNEHVLLNLDLGVLLNLDA